MKTLCAAALALWAPLAAAGPATPSFDCGGDNYGILSDGRGAYSLARYENGGRRLIAAPVADSAAPNPRSLCREMAEICAMDRIERVSAIDPQAAACVFDLVEMGALD